MYDFDGKWRLWTFEKNSKMLKKNTLQTIT